MITRDGLSKGARASGYPYPKKREAVKAAIGLGDSLE